MRRRISSGRVCGTPAIAKLPLVGATIVVRTRIEVVLPAPLRPSTPTTSPRGASKERSETAQTAP
jgi:hypothetical protein